MKREKQVPATTGRDQANELELKVSEVRKRFRAHSHGPAMGTADPLARTIVDFMALVETSLRTAEVAKMLRVDASRVRQRIRQKSNWKRGRRHSPSYSKARIAPTPAPGGPLRARSQRCRQG